MLKSKSELEKYLVNQCDRIAFQQEKCKEIQSYLLEKYHIPMGVTMDMITQRVKLVDQSEFILFCLLKAIAKVKKEKCKANVYYTEIEIKQYSDSVYEESKAIKFPMIIKCIQVSNDQWIGATDVEFLMELRKAQMINYNVNAQRTLTRVIKGEQEYYKISLNKKAVSEIRESFHNETYIPNTITLNISDDSNADFYYDENSCSLIINQLSHFDCSDGFHRYIGMSQERDSNSEFNYPMELRIINFSDDKTKNFISQEDKKTPMRKIDSKSMDMNNAANIVTERLNQDTMFNLKGNISRNGGLIPFAEFALLVDYFYFKDINKSEENTIRIRTIKELRDKFNYLTEYDETFLTKKYTYKDLVIILFVFANSNDLNKMGELINEVIKRSSTIDEKKFVSKIPRKSLMNDVEKIVKEIEDNVQ